MEPEIRGGVEARAEPAPFQPNWTRDAYVPIPFDWVSAEVKLAGKKCEDGQGSEQPVNMGPRVCTCF